MTSKTVTMSRELAEQFLAGGRQCDREQLRALLDAPSVPVDADQWYADTPDGDSALVARVAALCNHPSMSFHQVALLEGAISESAAPEAPRQEPVAEVRHGPFDDVGAPQWVRVVTLGDFDLENLPDGMKLYAAPLSPDHSGGGAGMVLPERMPVPNREDYDNDIDGTDEFFEAHVKATAYNSALDKVKELNQ